MGTRFNVSVSAMYGGVSRQVVSLRQPHQVQELTNFVPSVANGVVRRNPLELAGVIPQATKKGETGDLYKLHFIDRDSGERYVVIVTKSTGAVQIYDLTGTEKTVTVRPGWAASYLKGGDLRFCTVLDHTFIVNPSIAVAMEPYSPAHTFSVPYKQYLIAANEHGDVNAKVSLTVGGTAILTNWAATRDAGASFINYPYLWMQQLTAAFNAAAVDAGVNHRMSFEHDHEAWEANPAASQYVRITSVDASGWCTAPTVSLTFTEVATTHTQAPTMTEIGSAGTAFDVLSPTAWIHCISGASTGHVSVTLDGVESADIENTTYMSTLADRIKTALQKLSTAQVEYKVDAPNNESNVLRVWKVSKTTGARLDFTIDVTSDYGDTAVKLFKRTCGSTEDLPNEAIDGDLLCVSSVEANSAVLWFAYDAAGERWAETCAPGAARNFRATTMPLMLRRESDGTFTIDAPAWTPRAVGNEEQVPAPQFVGNYLSDVKLYRNRLVLVSGANVFLSRTSAFFELWPKTASEVLDDDPIDCAISVADDGDITWALPLGGDMLVFAGRTQLQLHSGNEALTPKTIRADVTTRYPCSDAVRPVGIGSAVIFPYDDATNGTTVREYQILQEALTPDAEDITAHCRGYIPTGIVHMAAAGNHDTVFCVAEDDDIYAYSFFWAGDRKMQSAWYKFTVPSGYTVLGLRGIGSYLYMILSSDTAADWIIARLNLEYDADGTTDHLDFSETGTATRNGDGSVTVALDSSFKHSNGAAGVAVLDGVAYTGAYATSGKHTFEVQAGSVIQTGDSVTVGIPYVSTITLSQFVLKDQEDKLISGRAQIMDVHFMCTHKHCPGLSTSVTAYGVTTTEAVYPESLGSY